MKNIVNHQNFEMCLNRVRSGESSFFIPLYGRCIKIDTKCIKNFDAISRPVIKKDSDGRGFRVSSGKKYNYVFENGLVEA
jgi:hypothetical protein